ncbi:MAG: hypothetical protein BroJett033_1710 [Chloroflexota bacterium]|nr:MAG: hypothetical protein BroJett033_1710 [Chloroflexota bacterium]
MGFLRKLRTDIEAERPRGQGLVEYALVIALVSVVTVGVVTELGQSLYSVYYDVVCTLGGEEGATCDCGAAERITVGPTFDCSGGMLSVQALTTCGDGSSLSLLFDFGGGDVRDVGLSYDSGSGLFVTSIPDTDGLCAALAGPNAPGVFLVSRKPAGETRVFAVSGGAGGPSDGTGDNPGGSSGGDNGGDTGGDGSMNPGYDPPGGGDTGGGTGGSGGDTGGGTGGTGGDTGGNGGTGGGTGGSPVANQDPMISPIATQEVSEGETLTVTAVASDPDGDALTFSATGLQSFMLLDTAAGSIVITPGAADAGTYPVTVTAGDGKGGLASVSFDVRVLNVNAAPVLAAVGAQSVDEGGTLTVTITATDGDFDAVTLTAAGITSFMTFTDSGGGSATFTAAPGFSDSGQYSVTVTAADPAGATASETFTVTVNDASARVSSGLIGLWWFTGFSGQNFNNTVVQDTSGYGAPLNLQIRHLGAGGDSTRATADGGLDINKSIIIESAGGAAKLVDAIKASNAFTMELWLASDNNSESGPGRIVTLSKDNSNQRNLTLAQGNCNGDSGNRYCLRLRTTSSSGYSQTYSSTPSTSKSLRHLVMTYSSSDSRVRIYIDGSLVYNQQISGATGALSGWNSSYPLIVGNEYGVTNKTRSDRDWTGDLYLLAFYDRVLSAEDVARNFAAGHLP